MCVRKVKGNVWFGLQFSIGGSVKDHGHLYRIVKVVETFLVLFKPVCLNPAF